MRLMGFALPALAVLTVSSAALAQGGQSPVGACAVPDSIAFRGQSRITEELLRGYVSITPKSTVNARASTRALADLFATGQFEPDLRSDCEIKDGKAILVFTVHERRILSDVKVEGPDH